MLLKRVVKQSVYAAGALTCLAIILGVITAIVVPSPAAPVVTPSAAPFEPIVVEEATVIEQTRGVDIVARLRNPNAQAGVAEYPVTFILLGPDGQEVARQQETTYLLPGSIHYVMSLGIPVVKTVSRVRVDLPRDPGFTVLPAAVALPSFSSFLRERTAFLRNGIQIEEQKGLVRNTGTLDWDRVEVNAVAVGQQDNVVAISKTFVGELKAGEQREFTLQWPAAKQAIREVVVLPTTNIYREENIVKVIGDPSLLR
jgi:hypothetical protein